MLRQLTLALSCYVLSAVYLGAEETPSPLHIVMDGREAAKRSNLTEVKMTGLAQSAANIILYVCGALAIFLTANALLELYRAADNENMYGAQTASKEGAIKKLIIAGLVSIPAIIAAILPYAILWDTSSAPSCDTPPC